MIQKRCFKALMQGAIVLMIGVAGCTKQAAAQVRGQLDYLIKDALVFDGTETEGKQKDIGIQGKKIVFIGKADKKIRAKNTIDATGLYLTPGFIDPHTHYGSTLSNKSAATRANMEALAQGVTTVFIGSDGGGTYEIEKERDKFERLGVGPNVAMFVGFGPVRKAVLGSDDVTPNAQQLRQMEQLVEKGMREGAFGLSTGLYYTPQSYSKTDEVVAMARAAKNWGGVYDTHMRSESSDLVKAVEETIEIGRQTGIPLMISHIKCLGPSAWGTSDLIIDMVHKAQNEGLQIVASQYPYIASHTSLRAMLVPAWAQAGGNAKMVERLQNADTLKEIMKGLSRNLSIRGGDSKIVISSKKNQAYHAKSLHQIAVELNQTPEEAAVTILKKIPGISAVSFSMEEDDVVNFMKQPWVTTGSDAGGGHPRTYSSFIKKLTEYTLDKKVLTMPQMIHRSTGLTADFLGITDRGYVREGYTADLVLFDPGKLKDNATYTDPSMQPEGVRYVFVNGNLSVKDGEFMGKLSGEALKFDVKPE